MNLKSIFVGLFSLVFCSLFVYGVGSVNANFSEKKLHFVTDEIEFNNDNLVNWIQFQYEDFTASSGDYFFVDVQNAVGYLINDSSRFYTTFPIMTGAKRTPTPYKEWVVLEKNIQRNKVVFSDSGEFFRMFMDGTKRTSYGIHGYGYFTEEIAKGTKFLSLGCVLVADDVLDLIEESFIANENKLRVITKEFVQIESYFYEVSNK